MDSGVDGGVMKANEIKKASRALSKLDALIDSLPEEFKAPLTDLLEAFNGMIGPDLGDDGNAPVAWLVEHDGFILTAFNDVELLGARQEAYPYATIRAVYSKVTDGWRDISTAPKDGTHFIGYWPGWKATMSNGVVISRWTEWGPGCWEGAEIGRPIDGPTLWMPIPVPK